MRKEVKRICDFYLSTLTLSDLQIIYDEAIKEIEETEYLHRSLLGLTDKQEQNYFYLKEETSIYSIMEQMAEQQVFNKTYNP